MGYHPGNLTNLAEHRSRRSYLNGVEGGASYSGGNPLPQTCPTSCGRSWFIGQAQKTAACGPNHLLVRWVGDVGVNPGFGPRKKEATTWLVYEGHSLIPCLSRRSQARNSPSFLEADSQVRWEPAGSGRAGPGPGQQVTIAPTPPKGSKLGRKS